MSLLLIFALFGCQLSNIPKGAQLVSSYTIVVGADADIFERDTAELLQDYITSLTQIELEIREDSAAAAEYEIFVGDTSRSAEYDTQSLANDEYYIVSDGNKISLGGNKHMIAAAAGELAREYVEASKEQFILRASDIPVTVTPKKIEYKEARNIILMIGDGMGFEHINAAKFEGMEEFYAENLFCGESITTSLTGVTDSAAGATAIACGYKTTNKTLGLDGEDRPVKNIRELSQELGKKTGIVTTDTQIGATPSAFLVHLISRNSPDILSAQSDVKLDYFKHYVTDEGILNSVKEGLRTVNDSENGFFMMIEDDKMDSGGHGFYPPSVVIGINRFNENIAYNMCFAAMYPDTILIVTADHETGGVTFSEKEKKYVCTTSEHTGVNVPVFAMGFGTEYFSNATVDNTDIAKFMARSFGVEDFGQQG